MKKINFLVLSVAAVLVAGLFIYAWSSSLQEVELSKMGQYDSKVVASPALAKEKKNDPGTASDVSTLQSIVVYKSPTCGCCSSWESYLEDEGFSVKSNSTADMPAIKTKYSVPRSLEACHTATVDGYVIEGHVPAADIKKLLRERPQVAGLAVPGMPPHSPGMQPKGEKPEGFDVLAFKKSGNAEIFTSYK